MSRPLAPTSLTPDTERFVAALNTFGRKGGPGADFFDAKAQLVVTRAPGRLDIMGGIADYSGSLVLQMPTAEATFAAIQPDRSRNISLVSLQSGSEPSLKLVVPLDEFEPGGQVIDYDSARASFAEPARRWGAYAAGPFLVLMRELGIHFQTGARILIESDVPQGKGVSSSAAIEVAVMKAIAVQFGIKIPAVQMALLCQKTENAIAAAPCGVMDQMTSVCGEPGKLLALLCQPADLLDPVAIPPDIELFGLDSGISHAVSGADYTSVRVGAFMGQKIISRAGRPETSAGSAPGGLQSQIQASGAGIHREGTHYLADVNPAEFEQRYSSLLPESIPGSEFLAQYGQIDDSATQVDPDRTYAVRQPAAHPIYENFRTRVFREVLGVQTSEEGLELLGELMLQSHASYSACGLGSAGTDLLVELARNAGPGKGVYGARISGGGCGGTVVVLARAGAGSAIRAITDAYERETGYAPRIFSGSSRGAAAFGHLVLEGLP